MVSFDLMFRDSTINIIHGTFVNADAYGELFLGVWRTR
jgi:hypothetical protein